MYVIHFHSFEKRVNENIKICFKRSNIKAKIIWIKYTKRAFLIVLINIFPNIMDS